MSRDGNIGVTAEDGFTATSTPEAMNDRRDEETSYRNMTMNDDIDDGGDLLRDHNHPHVLDPAVGPEESVPIAAFLLAFLSMSPIFIWSALKLGVIPFGLYFTIHMVTAPVAIYLKDRNRCIRWLAGFTCLVFLSGIKTVLFLTRFSSGDGDGDGDGGNDDDNYHYANDNPFDKTWLYAFTALWECSNALLVFGGRSILKRYGITSHSRALLAALCPAQVKFLDDTHGHGDTTSTISDGRAHDDAMVDKIKWNTCHLLMYAIIYVLCKMIFRPFVHIMESIPILEAEGLVILLSCIVHVWNIPPYIFQVCQMFFLPLLVRDDTTQKTRLQVIYPYGALYLSTCTREFWSRWSRPASSVLRHMYYYPLGGNSRAWISIPIMFLLNASSHYDVSNALVGDRAEMGWNIVFGVLGCVATLEVLGDKYFARNVNVNVNAVGSSSSQQVPRWYWILRFVLATASLRVAAYVLVHRCLHLSLSSMLV